MPFDVKSIAGYQVFLCTKKIKYLLIGGLNTLFGYCLCLVVYALVGEYLHVLLIGLICNVVSISFSFLNYKIFVFKSKGSWLREYLRCYVVYGISSIIGSLIIWLLVDGTGMSFQIAVALTMVVGVVFSWFGHSRFTYKDKKRKTHHGSVVP